MLFWIAVIVLVIAFLIYVLYEKYDMPEFLFGFICPICIIIGIVGLFFTIGGFILNNVNVDGRVEQMTVQHDMLVYQYENDIYDNDNDLGKRELIEDIQEWNERLALNKHKQHNFWIGNLVPDIYDQFEYIELEELDKKKVG